MSGEVRQYNKAQGEKSGIDGWRKLAVCVKHHDRTLWFPERGQHDRVVQAKALCAICPVRVQCLEQALVDGETIGIWGGLSGREMRAERKRRALLAAVLEPRYQTRTCRLHHPVKAEMPPQRIRVEGYVECRLSSTLGEPWKQ